MSSIFCNALEAALRLLVAGFQDTLAELQKVLEAGGDPNAAEQQATVELLKEMAAAIAAASAVYKQYCPDEG